MPMTWIPSFRPEFRTYKDYKDVEEVKQGQTRATGKE